MLIYTDYKQETPSIIATKGVQTKIIPKPNY